MRVRQPPLRAGCLVKELSGDRHGQQGPEQRTQDHTGHPTFRNRIVVGLMSLLLPPSTLFLCSYYTRRGPAGLTGVKEGKKPRVMLGTQEIRETWGDSPL